MSTMRKRFTGLLKRNSSSDSVQATGDSPEANAARGVRLFCESGGPNNSGEEVLHLPVIVDAAESSPTAAKEAANVIRKFLGKDNFQRAYVQYNAIMLMRILSDNPGKTFTRNMDAKFTATTKELLRDGRDMSVQQILRETLDTFQLQKSDDETLALMIKMWQAEKAKHGVKNGALIAPMPHPLLAPPFNPRQQNYFSRSHSNRGLPPPQELASRIEEARTSGKLLLQVVQSTAPNEIAGNELIREFSERCASASRSIQGYINAENPAPDADTMLTLIETNEQLALAMSKHQRAVLNARRSTSQNPSQSSTPPPSQPPSQPPRSQALQAAPSEPQYPTVAPAGPPPLLGMPKRQKSPAPPAENPFDDKNQAPAQNGTSTPNPPGETQTPYSRGYQSSNSYIRRQESSTNNTTMHGAAQPADDDEEEEPESPEEVRRYRF